MSVELCRLLDSVNWKEARKLLTYKSSKSNTAHKISTDAIMLLKFIAWKEFEDTKRVGMSETAWLTYTGLSRSAWYRQRLELEKTNLITRLTRGNNLKHIQVNLQVNRKTIKSLPKNPYDKKGVPIQGQTIQGAISIKGLNSSAKGTELALNKDAIQPLLPITTGAGNSENWNWLVTCIPHELRPSMVYGKELDNELSKLFEAGYSHQQIRNKLNNAQDYNGLEKPYPKVLGMLKELWSDKPVRVKLDDPLKVNFDQAQDIGKHPPTAENLKALREALNKGNR